MLQEQTYVSHLLARPDLIPAAGPTMPLHPTHRALLLAASEVKTPTPAYLLAKLDERAEPMDSGVALAALENIPWAEEVSLDLLLRLRNDVETQLRGKRLAAQLLAASSRLEADDHEAVLRDVETAVRDYQKSDLGLLTTTTSEALNRIRNAPPSVRWRAAADGEITSEFLDDPFRGVDAAGNPAAGMCGGGEIIVIAAGYGTGKTRWVNNIERSLLYQGARVVHMMLEDTEATTATALIGQHVDLPAWQVERYLLGNAAPVLKRTEEEEKIFSGIDWYESLGSRLQVYDGDGKTNIFNLDELLKVLELNVRVHGATHCVIDYIQALSGLTSYEKAAEAAQKIRAFAGRFGTNFLLLSQISDESMKWGTQAGRVAAKGAGDWGAAAHIGIELTVDFAVGQKEIKIDRKKARKARRGHTFARMNEETGRVLAYYDQPFFFGQDEEVAPRKGGRKK